MSAFTLHPSIKYLPFFQLVEQEDPLLLLLLLQFTVSLVSLVATRAASVHLHGYEDLPLATSILSNDALLELSLSHHTI